MAIISAMRRALVDPLGRPLASSALPWERGFGAAPAAAAPTLADLIIAATPTATKRIIRLSPAPGTGLTAADCYTLDGSACASWLDLGPDALHADQGTAGARPTYSATAIGSLPGLTVDGGDVLATSAYDLSAAQSVAWVTIFVDSSAGVQIVKERSTNAGGTAGGLLLTTNETAGTLRFLTTQSAGNNTVNSTAQDMSSPHLVTCTVDQAATPETQIRIDGANASDGRPAGLNNSGGFGASLAQYVGARTGPAFGTTGAIAADVELAWAGALPLAEVEAVETLLLAVGWT
jgi:hypothetical protein